MMASKWSHPHSPFVPALFGHTHPAPRVYRARGATQVVTVERVLETAWPAHHAPADDAWADATRWHHPHLLVTLLSQHGHGRRVTVARVILVAEALTAPARRTLLHTCPVADWWNVAPGDTFVF